MVIHPKDESDLETEPEEIHAGEHLGLKVTPTR